MALTEAAGTLLTMGVSITSIKETQSTANWAQPTWDFHSQPPEPGQPEVGTHHPDRCLRGHHTTARQTRVCTHAPLCHAHTARVLGIPVSHGGFNSSEKAGSTRYCRVVQSFKHPSSALLDPPGLREPSAGSAGGSWHCRRTRTPLPSPAQRGSIASTWAPAPPNDDRPRCRFRGDRAVLSFSKACQTAFSPHPSFPGDKSTGAIKLISSSPR